MGCNNKVDLLTPMPPIGLAGVDLKRSIKYSNIKKIFLNSGIFSILRFNIMQQSIRVWTIYKNTPTFENIE